MRCVLNIESAVVVSVAAVHHVELILDRLIAAACNTFTSLYILNGLVIIMTQEYILTVLCCVTHCLYCDSYCHLQVKHQLRKLSAMRAVHNLHSNACMRPWFRVDNSLIVVAQ